MNWLWEVQLSSFTRGSSGLRSHGHRHVEPLSSEGDLARTVSELTRPGDMVVCLGAGTISAWANALPGQLEALGAGAGA